MYCSEIAMTCIRGVKEAVVFLVHLFSPLFHQANRTEACLPVHTGGGVPLPTECSRDEKLTSWAEVNLMLSFPAGLALLSVDSSLINEQFTCFTTYAIGVYVVFLLSTAVYCMPSCLYKTMKVTVLSVSSALISIAYALGLKVVLCKGATSVTHTL